MSGAVHGTKRNAESESDSVEVSPEDSLVLEPTPTLPAITRLGRYRLVREIASGGMASVNLAVVDGLEKLVALKVIHPHLAKDESFVGMFLDEARIASSISHRNVCSVFDFGECDGHYFMAMEYLAGQSLREVNLRLRRSANEADSTWLAAYAAYVIAEACEGLHAAHELQGPDGEPLNVVHRDVSPHNLFITYDGNVSVVDFGIARASNRIEQTATGIIKGKFAYMAPEQVRQLTVDRRTDVWALGICLWESLTLQRLFQRGSQADTLMSLLVDPIPAPSAVRPGLPPGLDAIVLRALSRDPDQRFQSAREFGRELMQFCRASGELSSPVEIEHWMARLFAQEITRKKRLVHHALHTPSQVTSWPDASGTLPAPTHSGTMLKGWRAGAPPPELQVTGAAASGQQGGPASPRGRQPGVRALLPGIGVGLICALAATAPWTAWTSSRMPTSLTTEPKSRAPSVEPVRSPLARETALSDVPPSLPGKVDLSASHVAAPSAPAPETVERAVQPARLVRGPRAAVHTLPATLPLSRVRTSNPPDESARHEMATQEPAPAAPKEVATTDAPEKPGPVLEAFTPRPPVAASAPEPSRPAQSAPRAASLPPSVLAADAKISGLDVNGSLGTGAVSRMLARVLPLLNDCYAQAARGAGRNDFSPLPVSLHIDEAGAVRDVRGGSHPLPALSGCASAALRRLRSDIKPDVGTAHVRFDVVLKGR